MLLMLLAGQLLLLVKASFPDASHVNSSELIQYRAKRAIFLPSPNCPEPIYLTQPQVSTWPGITVDTKQRTILDETSGLCLFKCSEDTVFVYTTSPTPPTSLTAQPTWWLACGHKLNNGWRVGKAGGKDSTYGMIPVGCVKPTCTGLRQFGGNEFTLTKYPTYQIVPNKPSLIGVNQKFQFTCPLGSTLGYAAPKSTILLDASMKLTCESEGWWKRTSSNLAGERLSTRVACFKQLTSPPTLPTQCQTGIDFYTDTKPIWNDGTFISVTPDRAAVANGQWALFCRSGSVNGYVDTANNKFVLDSTMRITCESEGWTIKNASSTNGPLSNSVKVGCFRKLAGTCTDPALQFFTGSEPIIAANAAAYEFIRTAPSIVAGKIVLVCPTGSALGYPIGQKKLSIEPDLKISCMKAGWWLKAPNRVDGPIGPVKIGCFKERPTNLPPAPVPTVPRTECGCWYERAACRSCDSEKLFVLDGQGTELNGKCTLGCANGYMFEGGDMNMLSCQQGSWYGSSRSLNNVTVPLNGPFGYITASCVPAPTPGRCSLSYETFECEGCDASKIIRLTSPKSRLGCVLACDKDYRLLVSNGIITPTTTVIRAQEAVVERTFLTVYRLGDVKNPIRLSRVAGLKYSCEPVTADPAVPVKVIDTACNGRTLPLFDGSEPIIAANAAAYQFIRTIPSIVAGKKVFVCPTGAALGYPIGDKKLSIDPELKLSCERAGWWVKSPIVDGLINTVKIGCFKTLPTRQVLQSEGRLSDVKDPYGMENWDMEGPYSCQTSH